MSSAANLTLSKYRKQTIAQHINHVANNSRLVMLAHWNSSAAFEQARKAWKAANIRSSIVKVRVGRIGFKDTRASFLIPCLRGPTALVYADKTNDDDRLGQKLVCQAAKPALESNDVMFIAASLDGMMINRDQAQTLLKARSTPDQDLAATLSNLPMFSLPRLCRTNIDEIARIMEFHRNRLQEASTPSAEA